MGLLRRLFRALSSNRRPKRVEVRHETTVVEDLKPWAPRVAVRQTTAIRGVEDLEVRGRAWVIDGDTIVIGGIRMHRHRLAILAMGQPYS